MNLVRPLDIACVLFTLLYYEVAIVLPLVLSQSFVQLQVVARGYACYSEVAIVLREVLITSQSFSSIAG